MQLLAILGVAGAFATALYILKLRRRAVAVPFSKLWERILRDKEATSLFSKLKRLLSLLLQLALLALLALSLGDPRAAATLIKGRNLVVLVDASASMQATDVAPTRLGAAKGEIKKLIRGLGGADRTAIRFIMWITKGPTDPTGTFEFTDWRRVEAFGESLAADLRGDQNP